jgi:hypothetical protein
MAERRAPKEFRRVGGATHPSMKGTGSKKLHSSFGTPGLGQVRKRTDPAFKALKGRGK